jgi:hypothetical protein
MISKRQIVPTCEGIGTILAHQQLRLTIIHFFKQSGPHRLLFLFSTDFVSSKKEHVLNQVKIKHAIDQSVVVQTSNSDSMIEMKMVFFKI